MATIELGRGDSGATRTATVGDEVEVALEEIATSGHRWSVGEYDTDVLEAVTTSYDPPDPGRLGAAGVRRFLFRAAAPGIGSMHLVLARAWDPASGADAFEATIVVGG
jgi:predicted secreted protein